MYASKSVSGMFGPVVKFRHGKLRSFGAIITDVDHVAEGAAGTAAAPFHPAPHTFWLDTGTAPRTERWIPLPPPPAAGLDRSTVVTTPPAAAVLLLPLLMPSFVLERRTRTSTDDPPPRA